MLFKCFPHSEDELYFIFFGNDIDVPRGEVGEALSSRSLLISPQTSPPSRHSRSQKKKKIHIYTKNTPPLLLHVSLYKLSKC